MIATSTAHNNNASDLIQRFHEDCDLRGMVSTMEYIYRVREYCVFLEGNGKNPLNADKDDLRAFLAQLKTRELKFETIKGFFTSQVPFTSF